MKKTYIAPATSIEMVEGVTMMAMSYFDQLPSKDDPDNNFVKAQGGLDIWGLDDDDED